MKLTYKQAAYIQCYTQKHYVQQYLCDWTLNKHNDNEYKLTCRIKWWLYILAFIPVHIFEIFYCMWNGGLKEYEIATPTITASIICGCTHETNTKFARARDTWEGEIVL